jgi:hypothetical protein
VKQGISKIRIVGTLTVFISIVLLSFGLVYSIYEKGIGSSEAAGWTQAVGTIGAIWAAIWISRRTENDRTKRAIQSCEAFTHKATECVNDLASACKNQDVASLERSGVHIRELWRVGGRLQTEALSSIQLWAVYDIIGYVTEAQNAVANMGGAHPNWEHFGSVFQELVTKMKKAAETFTQELY